MQCGVSGSIKDHLQILWNILMKFDQNYVKHENHLINFNVNNVPQKVHHRAKIELQKAK